MIRRTKIWITTRKYSNGKLSFNWRLRSCWTNCIRQIIQCSQCQQNILHWLLNIPAIFVKWSNDWDMAVTSWYSKWRRLPSCVSLLHHFPCQDTKVWTIINFGEVWLKRPEMEFIFRKSGWWKPPCLISTSFKMTETFPPILIQLGTKVKKWKRLPEI